MRIAEINFHELSQSLRAQENARDGLRNRAIAILSTGALVFALTRSQSPQPQLDAWLVAALFALVVMGLSVAPVLLPAGLWTPGTLLVPDLFVSSEDEADNNGEARFYSYHIDRFKEGIDENRQWYNRASLLYTASTLLLLLEISLIAIHFTPSNRYRFVVLAAATSSMCILVAVPIRLAIKTIWQNHDRVFPDGFWKMIAKTPVLGALGKRMLQSGDITSLQIDSTIFPPPIPGLVLEPPAPAALQLEAALASRSGISDAFRRAIVLALGNPAGDLSPDGLQGSDSDVIHFTTEDEGVERTFLPVFTRTEFMVDSLRENPEWQTQSILEIEGNALIDGVDNDVTIVINPGSEDEGRID